MKMQRVKSKRNTAKAKCGLCGKSRKLTRTECCANWICDDEDKYVLFSFSRNSCSHNHNRFTLCAFHHNEEHDGNWQDCAKCRSGFETEMYVWYGTNDYNFEKLASPPAYKPTKCAGCGQIINLGEDGYVMSGKNYFCEACSHKERERSARGARDSKQ
jgi:hypothetical protein